MCDFSGRLVAWMDGELPGDEAADVGQHLRECAECRLRVEAYEAVSRTIVAYCDAAIATKTRRTRPYGIPVLAAAAAAVALLFLMFLPASVRQVLIQPRVPEAPSAVVFQTSSTPTKTVHRRHLVVPRQAPRTDWALAEPTIQIAIPAEAMFPPGAVPEGVNFIADLSIAADGSVQGLRLQP